jgi:hypothetical protein
MNDEGPPPFVEVCGDLPLPNSHSVLVHAHVFVQPEEIRFDVGESVTLCLKAMDGVGRYASASRIGDESSERRRALIVCVRLVANLDISSIMTDKSQLITGKMLAL